MKIKAIILQRAEGELKAHDFKPHAFTTWDEAQRWFDKQDPPKEGEGYYKFDCWIATVSKLFYTQVYLDNEPPVLKDFLEICHNKEFNEDKGL